MSKFKQTRAASGRPAQDAHEFSGEDAMNTTTRSLAPRAQRGRGMVYATISAVALLLGTTVLSKPAYALDGVFIEGGPTWWLNTTDVVKGADIDAASVVAAITAMSTAITGDLLLHSGQQSINSSAQIQANSQMMDTADARETGRRITDVKVHAALSSAAGASVCNVITGSVTAQTMFSAPAQWREEIMDQQQSYVSGATAKDRNQSVERRNALHCAVGATALDQASGLCPATTQTPETTATGSSITPTVGRDLSASVLLDPNNLTLNAADKQAANAFVINAFGSAPIAALPNGSATAVAGHELARRQAAENNSVLALGSVAQEVSAWLLADRSALPGTGGTGGATGFSLVPSGTGTAGTASMAEWAEGTAKQTIGYNAAGGNFPDGVSSAAYMKLRAMSWIWNPNWTSAVGVQGADQNTKDIAYIVGWQAYQNWVQEQTLERMSLTLATMLHIMEAQTHPAT